MTWRGRQPVVRLVLEDGSVVCDRCAVAATPLSRLRGLLGRSGLASGEGMLIRPSAAIHMLFMRFAIDAVFLDRKLVVCKVVPRLRPWRLAFARGAKSVVELGAGEAARRGVVVGGQLVVEASSDAETAP